MSYYASNYYQNPPPPYGRLFGETNESFDTVPGWGILPHAAGPEYVAIGALPGGSTLVAAPIPPPTPTTCPAGMTPVPGGCQPAGKGDRSDHPFVMPWWGWIVGAGVLGGGFAFVVKRGWV